MEQARTAPDRPGEPAQPALFLSRHYAAAPERVWRAWTDPQALKQWWGPSNEPVSEAVVDLRVGGAFRISFGGPQGREHTCAGEYLVVTPPRELSFTWCWPNSTPERVSRVTILFKPAAGGTDLEFRHDRFFDEAARDNHKRGWSGSLDKLERLFA